MNRLRDLGFYCAFFLGLIFPMALSATPFKLERPRAYLFSQSCNYSQLLEGRLPKSDKRYLTFLKAFELMDKRNVKVLIETGTARNGESNFIGDGGSTILFADWVSSHPAAHFYSVDIDKENLIQAERGVKNKSAVTFVCEDSISFLKKFPEKIDFLYLDSYDFDYRVPHLSQQHHLKEIEAAYDKLSPEAIVMIDDCALPYGGKGRLAIKFLTDRGWKKVVNAYQVILTR